MNLLWFILIGICAGWLAGQIMKGGGFGCPKEKVDMGFPEKSSSLVGLRDQGGNAHSLAIAGLALAVVALVFAARANRRRA